MPPPSRTRASIRAFLLILGCSVCGTASEIFLKIGANETAAIHLFPAWMGIAGLESKWVWLGIVFTLAGFVFYFNAVRLMPLGVVFCLSSIVHVFIPLSASIFLNESVTPRRWMGIALVLTGLFVVAKPFVIVEQRL